MLDKTLPYKDIIMKAPKSIAAYQASKPLPQGYHYAMYQEGDELPWAQLEASVGEFDCVEDALAYFHRVFSPYKDILSKRMCFIRNEEGDVVSTASAWYKESAQRRYALLHWVSTSPKEQGKGLAGAIVAYALSKFIDVEKDQEEIFLHTQTWSYKAISLYYKYGFRITHTPLCTEASDMDCVVVLQSILPEELMNDLVLND